MSRPTIRKSTQAIALDFDGVIADSMTLQEEAWRAAVKKVRPRNSDLAAAVLLDNLYRGCAGEKMFTGTNTSPQERSELRRVKNEEWGILSKKTKPFSGARDGLNLLRSHGYKTYLATAATRRYVEDFLVFNDMSACFEHIITDRDVPRPKPYPDMLLKVLTISGCDNSSLWMVGDTIADWHMSLAAGCAFVLLCKDSASKKFFPEGAEIMTARDWEELMKLFADRGLIPG